MRKLKYFTAINEAQTQVMKSDPSVLVMGLGVPGPTGIFGTTTGLVDKFGTERVLDMPSSEQGMTGVALGMTIAGYRPIMVHMRVDFATLAMDQMVNQVAKWHFMYGGKMRAPMVFRMIIGRGWGQGPQHSQSLQAWFSHIPGFKVVMPTTAYDAKGMLIAAIKDDAPVVFFEHRWLYGIESEVPEEVYEVSLNKAKVLRKGKDLTIVATSYMTLEALKAAELLIDYKIDAEVIDLRSLVPIDIQTLLKSVSKTKALIIADTGTIDFGTGSEVLSQIIENLEIPLKYPPKRIGLPFCPSPTSPALAEKFFPTANTIFETASKMFGIENIKVKNDATNPLQWNDIPNPEFTGPY
ncbi:MAG: alpha-ketoacid dehydrogenase subunit beta [Rhodospirillaceae bacterium]|nr:alpha-ketoacid dehydrogenase subunit beta [Rhodospirillaceae bacterium]|tara:strand:+ start:127 stop:1185 length:1059 start_codon:yes stop_codon:yes gene_type:complete